MIRCILVFGFSSIFLFSQPSWIYRYNGPGNGADWSNSIVFDADGNIYAGGVSEGIGTSADQVIISLQPSGESNWVYRYDSAGLPDAITQIVYGSDGNIYSSGAINGIYTQYFCIQSVSRAGALNWMYTNTGCGECAAVAIDYGADGNIYAAGFVCRPYNVWDYVVASIDSNGSENWLVILNGEGSDYDVAQSVVCGPDGNIYSAGYTTDTSWTAVFSVARHNQYGNMSWIDQYSPGNARKVICGDDSSIYALGTLNNICSIRKYRPNGNIAWTRTFDASIATIICGADGNIYGIGSVDTAGTGNDLMVLSLTPGNYLNWLFIYPDSGDSRANAIVYGQDGNLYAGGYATGSVSTDAVLFCLSTAGDTNWMYQYNGPGNGEDCILGIAYGKHNQVYASGHSVGSSNTQDLIVMCFNTLAVKEMDSRPIFTDNLLTVNPNPCFQRLNISLCLANPDEPISLQLYDVTGGLICNIMDNQIFTWPTIEYFLPPDLAAGVYYLILQTVDRKYLHKIVAIR